MPESRHSLGYENQCVSVHRLRHLITVAILHRMILPGIGDGHLYHVIPREREGVPHHNGRRSRAARVCFSRQRLKAFLSLGFFVRRARSRKPREF